MAPLHSQSRIPEPERLSEAMKPHLCQDRVPVAHHGAELKLRSLSTTPHQGQCLLSEWPESFRSNLLDLNSFSPEATNTLTPLPPSHCPLPTAQEEPSGELHTPTVVTGPRSPVRNIPSLILFGFKSMALGGRLRPSVTATP